MARILLACESDFFRFSRAVRLPMCSRVPVSPLHPALFVLSEGVLRERTTSPLAPVSLDEQALLAGALDGLRLLARLDLPVIVLAGMAGTLPNDSSPSCHDASVSPYQLRAALRARGMHVDAVHSYPLPGAEDRLHRRRSSRGAAPCRARSGASPAFMRWTSPLLCSSAIPGQMPPSRSLPAASLFW